MILSQNILNTQFSNYNTVKENTNKNTYITIGKDTFFQLGSNTFESFNFKLNKRGGESGKVEFAKMLGEYKIGDKVVLYVNGVRVFIGVIESIANSGLTLDIIPMWGTLEHVYITNTLSLESSYSVYDIVISLADKIKGIGIGFDEKNITIEKSIKITTTLAGRSIRDILDEIENTLPKSYVYGVDSFGEFYFKSFSENKEKEIIWHKNHFSDSELEKDYSNLYSQYIVKVKDSKMNAYNVLKDIVGESVNYPPTYLTEIIGKKTGVFECNFTTTEQDALFFAYQNLKLQTPIEILKLKNINYKDVTIMPNECLSVVLKPEENYYEDFEINYSSVKAVSSNINSGTIQRIGSIISYSKKSTYNTRKILDFYKQKNYVDICNRSLAISKVILYYTSDSSTDKFLVTDGRKENIVFGGGGIIHIDMKNLSKRNLKLILLNENSEIVFSKMRCYFNQGSRKAEMNVREITYSCKNGILSENATLSKLNTQLTGYMFERDKKIKNLEKLLTK